MDGLAAKQAACISTESSVKDDRQLDASEVIVMYDIRGIQDYIYRTAKMKDAIGASDMVDDIIKEALDYAVREYNAAVKYKETKQNSVEQKIADTCEMKIHGTQEGISSELEWCDEKSHYPYKDSGSDVRVLYIGGGNAMVYVSNGKLARELNQYMSRYVMEKTYSLQLAAAMVKKTDNYKNDYEKLYVEMAGVKATMHVSRPLGALPVMKVEIKTGYPAVPGRGDHFPGDPEYLSTETRLKRRHGMQTSESRERIIERLITKKGVDSTVAIVHIDGNNMGLRIRQALEGCTNYEAAVNKMREVSWNINTAYINVFQEMKEFFDNVRPEVLKEKDDPFFVMKIIAAGDDITYICNGSIAIATVQYFTKKLEKYAMVDLKGLSDQEIEEVKKTYGFSICAGIAYIGSHFPFYEGYETAEACAESAKAEAKKGENMIDGRVGNWFDYQICQNIQSSNLTETREREYRTPGGESLLLRPYYIPVESMKTELDNSERTLARLAASIRYFAGTEKDEGDKRKMAKSQAKELRNTYSQGEKRVELTTAFLASRKRPLPDNTNDAFATGTDGRKYAKYYDALELMDLYVDLEDIISDDSTGTKEGGEPK